MTIKVENVSPTLTEKIERLPPEKQAEVEEFVDRLAQNATAIPPDMKDLVRRIDERRERLLREQGEFPDSVPVIRDLREHGGR